MSKNIFLVSVLALLAFISMPASAKLYKWVDDNGVTHYGETIPPRYADKDRAELSKSGRLINKQEVPSADEMRASRIAHEEEEAKKRLDEKAALEKSRHDKMLVNTYTSVAEIELARKRNVQQIDLRINGINSQIKIVNGNLADLKAEAEGYEKRKRVIPASLTEDLRITEERLKKLENDLEMPLAEQAALNARFDADKARFTELTGKK